MSGIDRVVVSCEHATSDVPATYRRLFAGRERVLDTHRGWDPGAAELAVRLARRLGVEAHRGPVSRLLIECNRSLGHRALFSEFSRALPRDEREEVLRRYWRPYRESVEAEIARHLRLGRTVLHLSVHSFTPILDGEVRRADVGILYDPGRPAEKRLATRWREALLRAVPSLRVRRNYPYLGVADGFGASLRKRLPRSRFLAVELEINQTHLHPPEAENRELIAAIESAVAGDLA